MLHSAMTRLSIRFRVELIGLVARITDVGIDSGRSVPTGPPSCDPVLIDAALQAAQLLDLGSPGALPAVFVTAAAAGVMSCLSIMDSFDESAIH